MTEIYKSEYIIICLKKNVLYHTILNKLPNLEEFKKMASVLQTFFNICIEKNKHLYQIYNFNNIEISSIPEFSKCTNFITHFFSKNKNMFSNNLYCSGVIINNFLVRNAIKLVLSIYTPIKPFTFVKNDTEVYTFFKKIHEEYKANKWILGSNESTKDKTIDDVYYNQDNDNINDVIKTEEIENILKDKNIIKNVKYNKETEKFEDINSEKNNKLSESDSESESESKKINSEEYINKKKDIEEIIENCDNI